MRSFRLAAGALVAGTAFIGVGAALVLAAVPAVDTVKLGDRAPAFSARGLQGGAPVTSAQFSGKILVLNFWATWCPPCRAETPDMVRSYAKLKAADVAFLGIDTTEVPSVIKTFVSAKGVPYPIALAGPEVYNGFGIVGIPTTIVIDPAGIERARWIGEVAPAQLAKFVADARAGKNAVLDTPDERIVERLLEPAGYDFKVAGTTQRALANVAAAESFADEHSGMPATVDYARVTTLEGILLLPAGQAQLAAATTPTDRTEAARLLARAYGKLGRFADAVAVLQTAERDNPTDATLLLSIANADYRLHDYADGIVNAKAYTIAGPLDSSGWDELALLYQRSGSYALAAPAYERAIALLEAQVTKSTAADAKTDAIANVADTSLDLADVYVALGDVAGATRAFATANTYGDRLDPKGTYADLYRNVHERTQEGLVAVRLTLGGGRTALSIVPWTGPDLPGSVLSTLKYRLIVAKTPNAKIDLRALGLRKGWVASFCADGLCSPGRVSFVMPASGVKTYEFQLIPPHRDRRPGSVRVGSQDGAIADV